LEIESQNTNLGTFTDFPRSSAANMPMAYSPVTRARDPPVPFYAAVRASPNLVRNIRASRHTANLPTSPYVFNCVEPSNLIELPSPSRGGRNGATVLFFFEAPILLELPGLLRGVNLIG
jgi:hypothetical protein